MGIVWSAAVALVAAVLAASAWVIWLERAYRRAAKRGLR